MNSTQLANAIHNVLKTEEWIEINSIRSAIGQTNKDTPPHATLWMAMQRLEVAGKVKKIGKRPQSWKLTDEGKNWDHNNPYASANGDVRIVHETAPQSDVTPYLDSMRELIEELRGEVVSLSSRVKLAEKEASASVKEIIVKTETTSVTVTGTPHEALEKVVKLCAARINVLMIGPAGCGKTHLAAQVAEALSLPFAFVSCSAGMSEGQLLGRLLPTGKGGQFLYSRSEFVKCYEEGGVFLFDEVDAADSNTLLILNTALANGHLSVPNRADNPVAVKHPDFICIGAANTFGTGADRMYVGRNQLDEAFLDRFRLGQVMLDYDSRVEALICSDDLLRERLQAYRRNCAKGKVRRVVSTRFLKDSFKALECGALNDQQIDEALFGGWREDEIVKAKEGVTIKPRGEAAKEEVTPAQEETSTTPSVNGDSKEYASTLGTDPECPKHGKMMRMMSGKGWRCAAPGNKWQERTKTWSICDHCIFDKDKKRA